MVQIMIIILSLKNKKASLRGNLNVVIQKSTKYRKVQKIQIRSDRKRNHKNS